MIPVSDAFTHIQNNGLQISGVETISITGARGRITAADICATTAVPVFDNSAMDGYAVKKTDLSGDAPYRLKLVGTVAAGSSGEVGATGGCVRILTGAPVPNGYDTVIMQEKTEVDGGDILFHQNPPLGNNIRRRAEDISNGDVVIKAGTLMDTRHIAAALSAGAATCSVRRKLKVKIFSTGDELTEPGQPLAPGAIYDSNRPMMIALLDHPSIELLDGKRLGDEFDIVRDNLEAACDEADMIISTGGVSVGDRDHLPGAVESLGGTIDVWKVAMKPGKPVKIGTIGDTIFLGLPGNPLSSFVAWLLFGRSLVAKALGFDVSVPRGRDEIAGFEPPKLTTRDVFIPVVLTEDGLEKAGDSGSHRLMPVMHADGLAWFKMGSDYGVGGPVTYLDFKRDLSLTPL